MAISASNVASASSVVTRAKPLIKDPLSSTTNDDTSKEMYIDEAAFERRYNLLSLRSRVYLEFVYVYIYIYMLMRTIYLLDLLEYMYMYT